MFFFPVILMDSSADAVEYMKIPYFSAAIPICTRTVSVCFLLSVRTDLSRFPKSPVFLMRII